MKKNKKIKRIEPEEDEDQDWSEPSEDEDEDEEDEDDYKPSRIKKEVTRKASSSEPRQVNRGEALTLSLSHIDQARYWLNVALTLTEE